MKQKEFALWVLVNGLQTHLWDIGTQKEMIKEKQKLNQAKPKMQLEVVVVG